MSKCEYCGSYIEYATATCLECGECMLCWPEECSCVVIEPYDDLYEEEDEEEEDEEEDYELWGFPETGYIGPIKNCFT